jgi:AraC-like DNA-binding protein
VFDVLADVLEVLRIRSTLYALARLTGEWGVGFPAGHGAYFHAVEGHEAWLRVEGEEERRLAPGDVVLLAHGSPHRLTHSRGGPVRVGFDPLTWRPNQASVAAASQEDLAQGRWGTLVCGAVEPHDAVSNPLFAALPAIVHLTAQSPGLDDLRATLALIDRAGFSDGPGARVLMARLGDVLLVTILRAWLAEQSPGRGGWLGALRDPQIGAAIAAVHAAPDAPWTVTDLARHAALSRSRFSQRFTEAVGEPPLSYVQRWRMMLAAALLQAGDRTVAEVAHAVGYHSAPAFSRAFTQHHGSSPRRHARTRSGASTTR